MSDKNKMELSLMGTVAHAKLDRLLDGLERMCGPGSDWDMLESTMTLEKTDVKVRWTPGQSSMQIALVSAPVRTTSRPDGAQRAMEQVSCRPLSVVSEASAGHLKVLAQTGFLKKYAVYFRGKRFLWGKAEVTVCQVYAPAPIATSANDFTRRLLSPDWLVSALVCSSSSQAEEAAAVLLSLKNLLSTRVELVK